MAACQYRGCGKRATYMVSVPLYQQDSCDLHLAQMVAVVRDEKYGPHSFLALHALAAGLVPPQQPET